MTRATTRCFRSQTAAKTAVIGLFQWLRRLIRHSPLGLQFPTTLPATRCWGSVRRRRLATHRTPDRVRFGGTLIGRVMWAVAWRLKLALTRLLSLRHVSHLASDAALREPVNRLSHVVAHYVNVVVLVSVVRWCYGHKFTTYLTLWCHTYINLSKSAAPSRLQHRSKRVAHCRLGGRYPSDFTDEPLRSLTQAWVFRCCGGGTRRPLPHLRPQGATPSG